VGEFTAHGRVLYGSSRGYQRNIIVTELSTSTYLIVAEDCHRICPTNDGNAVRRRYQFSCDVSFIFVFSYCYWVYFPIDYIYWIMLLLLCMEIISCCME